MKRSKAADDLRMIVRDFPLTQPFKARLLLVIEGLEKPRKVKVVAPRGPVAMVDLYILTTDPLTRLSKKVALVVNNPVLAGCMMDTGPITVGTEQVQVTVRGL
jgi:hypothetical protein